MNFIGLKDGADIQKIGVEEKITVNNAAVLFLLDESGSMSGDSIKSLNDAINRFPKDVSANNSFARTNIEIAVMAFSSSVRLVADWKPVANYTPVSLTASGGTNLEIALDAALKKVKAKLATGSCDIVHIVLISDGYGGSIINAAREIAKLKSDGSLVFWMLGVPGYDSATAQQLTGGEHLYVLKKGKQFDYSDFITMIASAVIKIQRGNRNPALQPIPEVKRVDGGSFGGGSFGGGSFGGGSFGGGSFGGGSFGGGSFGGKNGG